MWKGEVSQTGQKSNVTYNKLYYYIPVENLDHPIFFSENRKNKYFVS